MFNPSRLRLARKRRGLTQVALAKKAGIKLWTLIAYDSGARAPSTENVRALAAALSFPPEFFFGTDLELPEQGGASFRAMKAMTAAQRDAALSAGALALSLSEWIGARFELPAPGIPNLNAQDPETAAQMVRADWGLGERPARNMVHLLESRGVRVFSLPVESLRVDAFSVWHAGLPFIFLNTKKSPEHSRFDAAHELGHLVLHTHGPPRGRDPEQEANRFASAFLMPSGSILASRISRTPTLAALIHAKRAWMVSVAALAYRLHALRQLSDWNYRRLCIAMAEAGYHRHEPESIQRETSQVLTKVFDALREDGVSRALVARDLRITLDDLNALTFGLVNLSPIRGGIRSGERSPNDERPSLRIV